MDQFLNLKTAKPKKNVLQSEETDARMDHMHCIATEVTQLAVARRMKTPLHIWFVYWGAAVLSV